MIKFITQQEYEERYRFLTPKLQDAVFSSNTANFIYEIARNNTIPINQMPLLAEIVSQVLFGFLPVNEFLETLKEIFDEFEDDKIRAIAAEIDQKIFFPVRGDISELKTLSAEKTEELLRAREEERARILEKFGFGPAASASKNIPSAQTISASINKNSPIIIQQETRAKTPQSFQEQIQYPTKNESTQQIPLTDSGNASIAHMKSQQENQEQSPEKQQKVIPPSPRKYIPPPQIKTQRIINLKEK